VQGGIFNQQSNFLNQNQPSGQQSGQQNTQQGIFNTNQQLFNKPGGLVSNVNQQQTISNQAVNQNQGVMNNLGNNLFLNANQQINPSTNTPNKFMTNNTTSSLLNQPVQNNPSTNLFPNNQQTNLFPTQQNPQTNMIQNNPTNKPSNLFNTGQSTLFQDKKTEWQNNPSTTQSNLFDKKVETNSTSQSLFPNTNAQPSQVGFFNTNTQPSNQGLFTNTQPNQGGLFNTNTQSTTQGLFNTSTQSANQGLLNTSIQPANQGVFTNTQPVISNQGLFNNAQPSSGLFATPQPSAQPMVQQFVPNILGVPINPIILNAFKNNKPLNELWDELNEFHQNKNKKESFFDKLIEEEKPYSNIQYVTKKKKSIDSTLLKNTYVNKDLLNKKLEREQTQNKDLINYVTNRSTKKRLSPLKAKENTSNNLHNSSSNDKIIELSFSVYDHSDSNTKRNPIKFEANKTNDISVLKEYLVEKLNDRREYQNIRVEHVSLIYKSVLLIDDKKISDYDIKNEDSISVVLDVNAVEAPRKMRKITMPGLADLSSLPIKESNEYNTKPDFRELCRYSEEDLSRVDNFEIYNEHARISFLEPVNLRKLNLDKIVRLNAQIVELYTKDTVPPKGHGLNKRMRISIYNMNDSGEADYIDSLKDIVQNFNGNWINYDEKRRELVFDVNELNRNTY
jgi:hypothetical protein